MGVAHLHPYVPYTRPKQLVLASNMSARNNGAMEGVTRG